MYECETCSATFYFAEECDQHMHDDGHWPECETCTKTFHTHRACRQHMDSTNHWAPRFNCETCRRVFRSEMAANQHMNSTDHWAPRFSCEMCTDKFRTQEAASKHMAERAHYKHYCQDCDRHFQNENNLRMHLHSKTHRGHNVPCPFCKGAFTTASGVAHHLETASCPRAPSLNRESILDLIRKRDPHGLITVKLIEEGREQNSKYEATSQAWNGFSWECYLCHKRFGAVSSLNAHLNSPAHKQKVYRCPNAQRLCGTQFTTMAGLFNHLESESCNYIRFENVQKEYGAMISGQKLIGF